jgi:S1-C subfamily serine protease
MSDASPAPLTALSASLAARAAAGASLVVALGSDDRLRTGLLWQSDLVVASEQVLPRRDSFPAVLPGGDKASASLVGRDRGTNVAVLRLDRHGAVSTTNYTDSPGCGSLALALGADGTGGVTSRLGVVHRVGPGWHSQAGGRIDRFIGLDMRLRSREEGGPVLDAAGALLGMSTLGPRGRVLVIPCATIARVLTPLLGQGRVERGWLGVGLQPVALAEDQRATVNREAGLMVVSLVPGGPAAQAGIMQGDILLEMDGEPVTDVRATRAALDEGRIGQPVRLRCLRAGNVHTASVTVAARPQG